MAFLLATTVALSSCSALGFRLQSPITRIRAEPRMGPGDLTAAQIQSEVMSFADNFNGVVTEAWNRAAVGARPELPQRGPASTAAEVARAARVRRAALQSKLAVVGASLSIAASPNPTVALADMITMVTLERMVLESPETVRVYGEDTAMTLAQVFRDQEASIWEIADRAMSDKQKQELRELIAEWRAENPDSTYVANIRLEDFGLARQEMLVSDESSGGSLLSLVALDPLAGLDPTQKDLQKSRMLGERMFFYFSRMPQLLKWQAETLYQGLFAAPEFEQMMSLLSTTAETGPRVAATLERLPADVAAEREATMEQLFEQLAQERAATLDGVFQGLTEQREELLREVDEGQGNLQGTLVELRETVRAADALTTSMTSTLTAAQRLADRVMPPPGAPAPAKSETDGLAEYRDAVEKTAEAADRLGVLAENIDRLLSPGAGDEPTSKLLAATAGIQDTSKTVIDHAFQRLLILVVVAPLMVALAAGLYRRASRSRDRPRA